MTTDSPILYAVDKHVATITMNHPASMNALNRQFRNDLLAAIGQAVTDVGVKGIVIASSGKGFCSGTDLGELEQGIDIFSLLEDEYKPILTAIMQSPKPVIAAVNGACAGIGASLALACDLVVMSENAFIFLAFAKVGLIPDGGMCWHLARNIGYKRAFEVIAEAGRIDAQRCKELGLVNKVVANESLLEEVQQWAQRLITSAPLTLQYSKQVLQQAMRLDLNDTMRVEAAMQTICAASSDSKEGVTAFKQKRAPNFTGK